MTAASQLFAAPLPAAFGPPPTWGTLPTATSVPGGGYSGGGGFYGTGRIAGTVRLISTPIGGRPVRLYEHSTGRLARETVSDGSGHFEFNEIDTKRTFYVTACDLPGGYNATIEDWVNP